MRSIFTRCILDDPFGESQLLLLRLLLLIWYTTTTTTFTLLLLLLLLLQSQCGRKYPSTSYGYVDLDIGISPVAKHSCFCLDKGMAEGIYIIDGISPPAAMHRKVPLVRYVPFQPKLRMVRDV